MDCDVGVAWVSDVARLKTNDPDAMHSPGLEEVSWYDGARSTPWEKKDFAG
jgi:hypothetical protein